MISSILKNPCNLYFGIWSFYLLQGTLYPSGSIYSRLMALVIIIIGIKEFASLLTKGNNGMYMRSLSFLISMYIIYGIFLLLFNNNSNISSFNYLKNYLMSLTPIMVCYNYAQKGYLTINNYRIWLLIFLVVAAAQYFRLERESLEVLVYREEITNNCGYLFLGLLPATLVYKDKMLFRYTLVFICSAFVIMSMKRGAILILIIALCLLMWKDLNFNKGGKKLLMITLISGLIVSIVFVVQNMLENSDWFISRINQTVEGDSSGRMDYYVFFWDAFANDTSFLQVLFGRGAESTVDIFGHHAHSDWFETLTNQGLLGIVIFTVYWIAFWKMTRNIFLNESSRNILWIAFVIFGIKTLFSMSIGDMSVYDTSYIGMAMANVFSDENDNY